MNEVKQTALQVNQLLYQVASKFKKENVSVVMPTYIPQRGEVLRELAQYGVDVMIAGGYKGARCFKEIPQVGMEEDTLPYTAGFPEYITEGIVNLLPEERIANRKVAVFSYVANLGWSNYIQKRGLNTEIVATVEQNLRDYFEEKGNLLEILDKAGLATYKIPTEHVNPSMSVADLRKVYDQIKNQQGKVVLQDCRSHNGNAGGKGTVFVSSADEFIKNVLEHPGERKAARFINGFESNLSFFAGNRVPAKNMLGAKKVNLTSDMDPFNPKTLDRLLEMGRDAGIDDDNVVVLVGRGTLKTVGDENLTSCESNGVGNDVGFVYDSKIRAQIQEIGTKLATLMAKAGKVGIAGADLIVDHDGKIWINEINDRQQGPTAQMSKDAEQNGLPSLLKVAMLASYADFNEARVQSLFASLQRNSLQINQAYMTSPGEFYMKVHSTHPVGQTEEIRHNLKPGFYDVVRQDDGSWKLEFSSFRQQNADVAYQTDVSQNKVTVKLVGGDWKVGDKVDNGSQLFRLTGVTNPKTPPFVIKRGKTILNPQWQGVVEACYNHLFGKGYMQKNPLYVKRQSSLLAQKNSWRFTPTQSNANLAISYVMQAHGGRR